MEWEEKHMTDRELSFPLAEQISCLTTEFTLMGAYRGSQGAPVL